MSRVLVECIENPDRFPYIKVGGVYELLSEHPTRNDYFYLKTESNVIAFYKKSWFKTSKSKFTDNEVKFNLKILNRRKKHLEDSRQCLLNNLQPILDELEKIRLEIDEIELK